MIAAHGLHPARSLLPEISDLTYLAADHAQGLAESRSRHIADGKLWPLA